MHCYRPTLNSSSSEIISYIKEQLKQYFNHDIFNQQFAGLTYQVSNNNLILSSENSEVNNFLRRYYLRDLQRFCNTVLESLNLVVQIENKKSISNNIIPSNNQKLNLHSNVVFSNFNDATYSFENFIVDKSNEFTYNFAKCFAGVDPDITMPDGNLLLIYGNVGCGKTHIIRAINNYLTNHSNGNVYFSAEGFTASFISALRKKNVFEFKESLINAKILIIDDVHCLLGRTKTINELTNIISNMLDLGKLVILTSAIKPNEFNTRLKSRLFEGIVTSIGKPTKELKSKIVNQIITQKNIPISLDVAEFLVNNVLGDIRGLKGAISRLALISKTHHNKLTIDFVKHTLKDLLVEDLDEERNFDDLPYESKIKCAVGAFYNLDPALLSSSQRTHRVSLARNIAMYITQQKLRYTLEQIANCFNRNSHNSVLYGIKQVAKQLPSNEDLQKSLYSIYRIINKT